MIKNLINETDYSVIKKTKSLYFFFQLIIFGLFLVICLKLIFIISIDEKIQLKLKEKNISSRILDRNNNILAQTITNHSLEVNNFNKINNINQKNNLINDIKIIDPSLANKINDITSNFFYIDRSPKKIKILNALYLGNPDIKFKSVLVRDYPFDVYTRNILGNRDIDNNGLSLIEKYIDNHNQDLNLSLDIDIQKISSDEFNNSLLHYDADYGFFVLVDLLKEEILVNIYLNNSEYQEKFDNSLMPIIDLSYEFGSVFKPITVYSAIKNNHIDLDEYFDVQKPLKFSSGRKNVKDLFPSKIPLKTKDILRNSSNIGAVLINRRLDCKKEFKNDLKMLGLLEPINVMANIKTINPKQPQRYVGDFCDTMAYGYGIQVTPLHLINSYSRMITGKKDFNAVITTNNKSSSNILNKVNLSLNRLLYYANQSKNSLYNNCLIAGKTGTAEKKINSNSKINNVTYISYFPYTDPRYLALTFMNNPKKSDGIVLTAGNTVKNTFYNILDKIIFSLDISSCEASNKII